MRSIAIQRRAEALLRVWAESQGVSRYVIADEWRFYALLPEDASPHPSISGLAYSRREKRVYLSSFHEKVPSPDTLHHEVVHVLWPEDIDATTGVGPAQEEWRAGLLPWELAVARRVFRNEPDREQLYETLVPYAYEGRPCTVDEIELCVAAAKRVVAEHSLFNPWSEDG